MAITTYYQTSDKNFFDTLEEAQAHERDIESANELLKNLEAYDINGHPIYVKNIEDFNNEIWSIIFHNKEELNLIRNLVNLGLDLEFAPYEEKKGLVYIWDEDDGFISLYDYCKNLVVDYFPTEKIEKFFPY